MSEKILLVINGVKNFAKYLVVPTGVITFFPDKWLTYVRLLEIKNSIGMWISSLFFITLSVVIIDGISKLVSFVREKTKITKIKKSQERLMLDLNNSEKKIIKKIFEEDNANFNLSNASICKLEHFNIIFRSEISTRLMAFSFSLQPWVADYLKKNPGYLDEI